MIPRRAVLALAGAAAAIPAVPALAAPAVHVVTIKDMAYTGVPPTLRAGDVIEWVNDDLFRHTVTARDGSFDVDIATGQRARITLRKRGQIAFYCRYHPGMKGTLVVK
jgi:plastocyanin